MHYFISGETYSIKEDLKSCGCIWVPKKKKWKTPSLEEDEPLFKKIKSMCRYSGVKMVPEEMNKECKKIQEILGRKEKRF